MSEQRLDGAQIGAGFEQMGGETVAQGMRGYGLAGDDVAHRGDGVCHRVPGDVAVGIDPAGKQPRAGPIALVVAAQVVQQDRRQRHQTILAALALHDVQQHPLAVDVCDSQGDRLGNAQPGRIQGHRDDAVLGVGDRFEYGAHLVLAQHQGQLLGLLGERDGLDVPALAERLEVQEAEGADRLIEAAPSQLSGVHQMQLIGPYIVERQQLRGALEVASEQRDLPDVAVDGAGREVAHLHVFDHSLTQWCHDGLLLV